MSKRGDSSQCKVAIACGGTGGHFFPGVAVAQEVRRRGGEVMLLASRKGIDREAAAVLPPGVRIEFLPSVALLRGRALAFVWGGIRSLALCWMWFWRWRPDVVLVMGGFTSAAPAMVGRLLGARVYLHEANSVPGRANRFLARLCRGIFVGFPSAGKFFGGREVVVSGTPVRSEFEEALRPEVCQRLDLVAGVPVLLVMGGSQGARALNVLMLEVAPRLARRHPGLQIVHLTGKQDQAPFRTLYQQLGLRHYVSEFCADASGLIRLATAVLSRAGASSLAEYAAVRVPALLIPYPQAADDHQRRNAAIFAEDGAAEWLDQRDLKPSAAVRILSRLLYDMETRRHMKEALRGWDSEGSAARIVDDLMPAGEREGRAFGGDLAAGEEESYAAERSGVSWKRSATLQEKV